MNRLRAERSGVQIPAGARNFILSINVHTGSGPTKPPIKWALRGFSAGVKQPVHESDHSSVSSVEARNEWSYTSASIYALMTSTGTMSSSSSWGCMISLTTKTWRFLKFFPVPSGKRLWQYISEWLNITCPVIYVSGYINVTSRRPILNFSNWCIFVKYDV